MTGWGKSLHPRKPLGIEPIVRRIPYRSRRPGEELRED